MDTNSKRFFAEIAQLVESNVANVVVGSSNLLFRFMIYDFEKMSWAKILIGVIGFWNGLLVVGAGMVMLLLQDPSIVTFGRFLYAAAMCNGIMLMLVGGPMFLVFIGAVIYCAITKKELKIG